MKYKLLSLLVFLAIPAVAAAPPWFRSTCDVQVQVLDGRDVEGLPIPGQGVELTLPCITKGELARVIKDFGKGDDAEKTERALDALRRATEIKLTLTPEVAMRRMK